MARALTMRRHIILHFDLNRTILMSDAAGGRSMENTVNYLLSECVWGISNEKGWTCASNAISFLEDHNQQGKITYKMHVDKSYPYLSISNASEPNEVESHNRFVKNKRRELHSSFTNSGAPGESFKKEFDQVMEALHFPSGTSRDYAIKLSSTLDDGLLKETWCVGRYFLLPSFLGLVAYLDEIKSSLDINISIVFRTFGTDIPEVAKELDLLVDGKHPLYLGRKFSELFRLKPPYATFYRDGIQSEDCTLAYNTLEKVPESFRVLNPIKSAKKYYTNNNIKLYESFEDANTCILEMLSNRKVIAVRDYWEWWHSHAETADYGKLLFVKNRLHQRNIIFDDHIEHHDAHIVDVRNLVTGSPMPFEVSKKKYLRKVEPYLAIIDHNYYIAKVNEILSESE